MRHTIIVDIPCPLPDCEGVFTTNVGLVEPGFVEIQDLAGTCQHDPDEVSELDAFYQAAVEAAEEKDRGAYDDEMESRMYHEREKGLNDEYDPNTRAEARDIPSTG